MMRQTETQTTSFELDSLLKAAMILLAVNLFFGIWFWLSPNVSNIEPKGSEMAFTEAKPSPFFFEADRKRPVTKAQKLKPVIVESAPDPGLIAVANEFLATESSRP